MMNIVCLRWWLHPELRATEDEPGVWSIFQMSRSADSGATVAINLTRDEAERFCIDWMQEYGAHHVIWEDDVSADLLVVTP